MKALRRHESGFSAVEMLITIVVIGLVFGAFVTTFVTLNSIVLKSNQVTTANKIAFAKLQDYENMAFASLPGPATDGQTSTVETFSSSLPGILPDPKTGTVQIMRVSSTLKKVTVTVSYGSGGNARSIIFDNFIQQTGVAR